MLKTLHAGLSALIITMLLVGGCVPKEYTSAMKNAMAFEEQGALIKAYKSTKKALEVKPDDEEAMAKLSSLGKEIATGFTESGNEHLRGKRHNQAIDLFEKAFNYVPDFVPARTALADAKAQYAMIEEKYAAAESAKNEGRWGVAVDLLTEIATLTNEDTLLSSRIDQWRGDGYDHHYKAGIAQKMAGDYTGALENYQSAGELSDTEEIREALLLIRKYIRAGEYFEEARKDLEYNNIATAMDKLILAREKVADHKYVNRLFEKLTPKWSELLVSRGQGMMVRENYENAYTLFGKLFRFNRTYPGVKNAYYESRDLLLKQKYRQLLVVRNLFDLPATVKVASEINHIQPAFLDTLEIMNRTPIEAYNIFYQKGLSYLDAGNYGKAILCFRSAEAQLDETLLTREKIKTSWEKIRDNSRLNIAFWPFFQKIGDPSITGYATKKGKELLRSELEKDKPGNLFLYYNLNEDNTGTRSGFENRVDWVTLQSANCNAVLVGHIKGLKLDKSMNSEWKIRTHTQTKIIDNKEYLDLVMKRAKFQRALIDKKKRFLYEGDVYTVNAMQKMIREIDIILPGTSPKVEAEVEEQSSYLMEKHVMTAYIQVDMELLSQNGTSLWKTEKYHDTFQVEDVVAAPDLQAATPEQRMGDPLTLPTESEFKEMAMDHILQNKIIPDMVKKFRNYGMRYFSKAEKLSPPGSRNGLGSKNFQEAIESYYKFLICYKDKGAEDTTTETVLQHLDDCVSDWWLIRN